MKKALLLFSVCVLVMVVFTNAVWAQKFAFVVISDPRPKDHYSGVEQDLLQVQDWINNPTPDMPAPVFLENTGDFDHTRQMEAIIDSILGIDFIWFPIIGNHEIDAMYDFYCVRDTLVPTLPWIVDYGPTGSVNTSYSWDYGNAHFVSANCYWDGTATTGHDYVTDGDAPKELRDWIEADLSASSKPHKFVFIHEPPYPEVRHVGDSLDKYPANRDSLVVMLDRNGVEALFVGHDHYYHHDVSSEHPLLGDVHQVDSGQLQGPGSGGDGSTILYMLVDGDTTTYKAYRSTTGMPFSLHEEWYIVRDGDYTLDVTVLGDGSVTLNPPGGTYPESTSVELTAVPDSGWTFGGWSGDLTGSMNPDTLLMTGHMSVTATFVGSTMVCEDFESGYTLGAELRTHADWFYEDGNSGPIPTAGIGVNSSIGLSNGDRAFSWVPHEFNWNDPTLVGVYFQMDYQTDATGTFDDDRLGWTISDTDDNSDWIFGVQMDPGGGGAGGNIETYWDGDTFGDDGGRYSIVDLPALSGSTWYRLRGEFTKLTATSAQIDVTLWELDAAGDTVGVVASGTVADTDSLPDTAGEEIPNPAYFTATGMWPVYKNYDGADGSADNPCFGIIASGQEQYTLSLTIVGNANVNLDPPGGIYDPGTEVELTAVPESAWVFSGWSGDLTGNTNPDTITMDSDKSVTATFVPEPSGDMVCENFESGFTLGQTVGNHGEWFDGGNGPVVNSGIGVATSIGLAAANNIFIWTAHPFYWTATDFQGYHVQMDFQTDGSGYLDDDRVGWMIVDDDVESSNIFGVQCDPGGSGYNIEGYWDGPTSADRRPSIVDLPALSANSWYRLRAKITKLTATSASIFAALIELDASGDSVSVVASGSIPNTATLGDDAPNSKYFTGPIWPAYKNYTAAGANADNACFQVLTSGAPAQDTLTVNIVGSGSVDLSPPGGVYTTGTKVGLTANPDSGWAFSEWSGDLTGSTNPDTITMAGNMTVTATFTEIPVEGNWTQQSPDPHPLEKAYHRMAYVGDDQAVLFGGRDGSYTNYNETWVYDFSENTWTQKNPSTKPSVRRAHAMAYLGGDQVLMFGGWDGSTRNDETWIYDLSDNDWTQMSPSTSPSARLDMDMAYIAAGQVLMFGGDDGANDDETWVYDSSDTSWIQMFPATHPSARHSYALAYIGGDQALLFGGDNGSLFDQTWVYDLSDNDWTQMSPSTSPSARSAHAQAYIGGDQVLMFGGHDGSPDDETWVYDLGDDDWAEDVGAPHPSARYGHGLSEASMGASGRVVLFGGNTGSINDETWTFGMAQYTLTVNTVGNGSVTLDPPGGVYNPDAEVELTATADSGWVFSAWSGDLTGSTNPDTITMTADMTVTATFVEVSSGVFCEDFESGFTLGVDVGEHADWFDGADTEGSDVTAGIGLLGSIGLGTGNRIFTWTAHPFDWNAPDFQKVSFQMDFQTDGSGQFDDDRMGWMITGDDYSSENCFGAQLDHSDGGIVTYWRDSTDTRIQTQIVDISGLAANTWFRFRAEISRLAATDARIDVSLVELDGSGNPTGTPYTGTVANTSTWPDGAPDTKYFTASTIWPAYKNYQAVGGAADNACAEILIFAGPWDTLTVNTVGNGSVTLDPPGNIYPESTAVELTAVPDSGWKFSAWSGDLTGSANPDTIIMAGNMTVTATFVEWPPCTLTVNTVGNGSVTLDPPGNIYPESTAVELTAVPDSGWVFDAWSGGLTGSDNPDTLTMAGNMTVTATFVEGPECTLTVNTVGSGSVTLNPPGGVYGWDATVELTAVPDSGWVFDTWSGDLTGSANPDTIVMIGNMTVTATFVEEPSAEAVCEDFESGFTLGQTVGSHSEWFDAGNGPVVNSGLGVASSIGLAPASAIFIWTEHPFDWTAANFLGYRVQLDFQTDGSGYLDDDRVGWMITDDDVNSSNIFGVQCDPGGTGYNIEGYWDGPTSADRRPSIVDLPTLSANSWYRLYAEITKLGAASASVYAALIELDANGDSVSVVASGSIPNTADLGDDAPSSKYFIGPIWPAYKNYTAAGANADNACFQVLTSGPVQQDTLTVNLVGSGSVNLNPPGNIYDTGTDVELTAVSDSGWVFSAWSGDLTGSANPDTITMAGNMTVTATFVEGPECTLTVNTVGSGSVTLNPDGGVYDWDAKVELTAVPDSGWAFSVWSGDLTGSANPDTIIMVGNMTVTATFIEESELTAGDVIISGMQAWNSVGSQDPAEFVELFNTTDQTISLENMELISRTDNDSDGELEIDWQLSATLAGKSIAPHSFFLIAESGVAADSNVRDVETDMDLATGEGGVAERAISLELLIDGAHMDYVLYGRDDGQNPAGEMPPGDIPFDSSASWPRSEVCRNTQGSGSFYEGLLRRETADDLYAGYAVNGYYTDEGSLGQGYPDGVWYSPHDNTYDSYVARSSASDSVLPPYNNPPNQPTLVSPLDDAIDVALDPELRVNVTDSDADTMSVTFYGREVSASGSFTLIPIPDTQKYSLNYPWIYYDQMQWIVDSMAVWNIVFAAHEGDIVDTYNSTLEWLRADTAMSILEDPMATGLPEGIPYSVCPGNHDTPTTNYNIYFGVSRFSGRSYYGGHYGSTNDNNYCIFSAGGMDFIVISLQYNPGSGPIAWADSLLAAHSDRRGIVVSHYILETNGNWGGSGQTMYDTLKDNPNLFLMLCGHRHGEALRTEVFNGDTVHVVLADYQDITSGGNGWLRIMEFQPANNRIRVLTYSPYIDQYGTDTVMGDDTISEEFFLSYDMSGRSAFTNLGTVDDVASGDDAFITWSGRSPETEYEWYVQVDDGVDTTTSSTWSFTTVDIAAQCTLTVNTVGNGNVTLDPPGGVYDYGTDVELTANADSGWVFSAWSGDLTGSANPDTITMNSDKSVTATFVLEPSGEAVCEDFESGFTLGQMVGTHADWYDGGNGPVVNSGIGVAASVGLAAGNNIFIWTAHSFDWTAGDFQGYHVQMDFQTDGSGHLDDDRVGWMITDDDVGSSNIFGVQCDPGGDGPSGYNIEGYWDGASPDKRPSIVNLPTLLANTFYRFRAEITKLDSTSASIDVMLIELDASGDSVGVAASGSIANTADLGDDAPNSKYFTGPIWPAYKNYTTAGASADNACFQVLTTPTQQCTLTVNIVGGGSVGLDPPGGIYDQGTDVELMATADSGWTFAGWSGDLAGSANPDTITMTDDMTVTATFNAQPVVVENLEIYTAFGMVDSTDIRLIWSPVTTDTAGSPITVEAYVIYRDSDPGFTPGPTKELATTTDTTYVDSNAAGNTGVHYFYYVNARSGGLESENSRCVGEFDKGLLSTPPPKSR